MRKNFKRALALLCAAALTTLSVAVAGNLSSLKTAAEVSPSGEINFGVDSAYLKLDNALTSAPASVEAEVKIPSTIKDEWILLEGGKQDNAAVADKVSTGTTTEADKPGAGIDYLSLGLTSSTISVYHNLATAVDISKYSADELKLSFWAYSETAGALADGGRIRLSKNVNGNDAGLSDNNTTLDRYAAGITVEAGWNYIELPLSTFTVKAGGDLTSIGCFKLHGVKSNSDKELRIAEVKLAVISEPNEWTLLEGGKQDNSAVADKISTGTTTEADKPGAGIDYLSLGLTSSTISVYHNLATAVDISKYSADELKLSFWAYSETAGALADGGRIRLSKNVNGNDAGLSDNNTTLDRYAAGITVEAGWNYIELPLSTFTVKAGGDLTSIGCFKFHGVKSNSDKELRIAEVKLIADTNNEVLSGAVDADVYSKGYSILSNLGSEDTPYALFVTREGKPAFIYNDKMFVLNYNVCTGEFVKIGAAVNADGTVTFTAGDYNAASTDTVDTASEFTFTSGHSIGADANGGTLMNGSIKNLVVRDNTGVVENWTLAANKAYPLNAVKDSAGLNDAHFAGIANSNAAVVVKYGSATAGTAPADADDMDGYVFAGWFTDADCTKALEGTGSAYAKYVDKAVLTVKAQIKNGAATAETTSMRFVTTVDSLNYKSVGFVINNVDKTLKTVYSNLYVVGDSSVMTKTPADVSNTSVSAYFAAFTVNNIHKDKYSAEFNVTPYWITLDGTRVSADTVVKTVSQGI